MAEIIEQITQNISKLPFVEKIILFGSRARGDCDERSDIDIAISGKNITEKQWLDVVDVIDGSDTLLKIDIIRFETASDKLKSKITGQGKVLYER